MFLLGAVQHFQSASRPQLSHNPPRALLRVPGQPHGCGSPGFAQEVLILLRRSLFPPPLALPWLLGLLSSGRGLFCCSAWGILLLLGCRLGSAALPGQEPGRSLWAEAAFQSVEERAGK